MKMMKNLLGVILFVAAAIFMISCENQGGSSAKDVTLNNELDSVSYAIGIDIATNIKKSGFEDVNPDAIAKGFADVYAEGDLIMDAQAANTYVMAYFNKARERKSAKNLEEAEAFLAENKDKEGVITTESGLQYKIINEGSGPIPVETDKVSVYYKGTLADGREFDGTQIDNPAQFRVNGVIKGWIEALQLMPVGSKWELYIHPDLAYGANPRQGGIIEPNHMLIFEIELLEIVDQK
jgi:FKBP-type peptidyl-prolyl cis-trans isomerase FklB